jgi:glycosyltransferase involved in cell wall biosynthesis/protein-tyrosine-phosphatase
MSVHVLERPVRALARTREPQRLRVCHVMSADLWAGAEVQVATVASYLVEAPDVDLTAVLLNDGPLAAELRGLGVPVTVIDERTNNALEILAALTRHFRARPVDVVHTHRGKDTVLGALAARLAGVRGLVRTVHGHREPMRGWDRIKFGVYEALDTWTLRCLADRVVAVSRRLAGSLDDGGYGPGTVVHIPNGVDVERIRSSCPREDVRRALGIDPTAGVIGIVGRLTPVKGHALFLRAARRILDEAPRTRFVIVGDGPLRTELERTARELGLAEACVFAGARRDVYDLVGAMDVFVLSSLHEGAPMALLEAMVLGTPVVATAVGGVPEILTQGTTGLLVEGQDANGLAAACLELVRNREWARSMAERARRVAADKFSHRRCGAALVGAYHAVTHRPRVGSPGLPPWVAALARGARRSATAALGSSARRRMESARRDPVSLKEALRSARQLLVVCHGNIIRSPFAARLLTQKLGDRCPLRVVSRGLGARPGTAPPAPATLAAAGFHVDLTTHRALPVSVGDVAASDVIFVMDGAQLREMQRRYPASRGKTFLLTSLAPDWPLEVRDPFAQHDSVFQASYEHIAASVGPIARLLPVRGLAE